MKKFHLGMQFQLLVVSSVCLLMVNLVLGSVLMKFSKDAMKSQLQARMLDMANIAASTIDGDMYDKITDSNAHSKEYQHVYGVLSTFLKHSTLSYVYGLRQVDSDSFVFTIDPALSNAADFGESAKTTDALRKASRGVPSVCDEPYEDSYGKFYTAYSPILNSEGDVVGFVAVDCDAQWYDNEIMKIEYTILYSCIISLVIGASIVLLFMHQLRKKFKELNSEMRDLAVDVDSFTKKVTGSVAGINMKADNDDGTDRMIALEQKSYDEIHELGKQIRNMRHDLQEYIDGVYSLAFRDPLTGVKSKQAYVEYEKMMNRMIEQETVRDFAIVAFDVNGLKRTNDVYGHSAGDELLKSACSLICETYSHSPVFRIGGDEFVAILNGKDYGIREELFRKFGDIIVNNIKEGKVVVAHGMSEYLCGEDNVIQDVFDRADELMYERKKKLKAMESNGKDKN